MYFRRRPNTVCLNAEVILVHGDSEEAVLALEYLNDNGGSGTDNCQTAL